ncbi:MAG: DUF1203 domain-containing protein [Sphingomicrobium sp.]
MTYRIRGLDPDQFAPLLAMTDEQLAGFRTIRVRAESNRGFPCRVSLEDARDGESLILTHYVSHDVATPYRTAYAVYVRENATSPAEFIDCLPPVFEGRPLSLRGFGEDGMLKAARLAAAGAAEAEFLKLLDDDQVAYVDAHNAAYGCFAARIERYESASV